MDTEKIEKVLYDNILEYFLTVQRQRNEKNLILFLEHNEFKKDIDKIIDYCAIESRKEFKRLEQNLDLLIQIIKNNNSNNEDEVKKINGIN